LVKRGFLVAVGGAAIVAAGLSGCGSDEKKAESESPATSAEATTGGGETTAAAPQVGTDTSSAAKITIDGKEVAIEGAATCATTGGTTNIAFGSSGAAAGIVVVLGQGDPPPVQSVVLGNIDNISLGFTPGVPGGSAEATKDGNTYKITGTATGVDMANPLQPATKPFEIVVPCP
jgi:lipoprotein LpqH